MCFGADWTTPEAEANHERIVGRLLAGRSVSRGSVSNLAAEEEQPAPTPGVQKLDQVINDLSEYLGQPARTRAARSSGAELVLV
jgi:hypothetical protein